MIYKKGLLHQDFNTEEWITFLSCMAMMLGFLYARALLSIGMIVFFISALKPAALKANWHRWKNNSFAIFCFLFFLTYLLSGFWTEHIDNWVDDVQMKLSFLALPFAMLNASFEKQELRKWIIYGILIILLSGIFYSSSFMITNPRYLATGAHLPSPVARDYIRFTIAIVLGLQLVFYLFNKQSGYFLKRREKILLIAWSVVAVIYLHVEAAKSGLVCFYLLIGIYLLFRFYKKYGILKITLTVIIGLAALFIAAYTIPALNRQMNRLQMEKRIWESGNTAHYNKVSSIVPRLISYEAAFIIIREHPLYGVGGGDMKPEMDRVYQSKFPFMKTTLVPHNQYLCTAVALGIPLTLVLVLMMLAPLWKKLEIYTVSTFLIMVVSSSIEPLFEVQYGVFVYLFFTLFWMVPGVRGSISVQQPKLS